jgi:predicted ATP-dependent Lon-type protease
METICIFLNVEPVKMKSKDGLGFVKDYWLSATGKYVLGN